MSVYLSLEPRDTVVARDSRPFGGGSGRKMRTLPFVYPQLPAGTLRTLLGKIHGGSFDEAQIARLLGVACHGPLLEDAKEAEIWFPAPRDMVCRESGTLRLRPAASSVTTGPAALPELAVLTGADASKPLDPPPFLPAAWLTEWLLGNCPALPKVTKEPVGSEERVHVSLNAETGAAEESLLFVSSGLRFAPNFRMSMRVHSPDAAYAKSLDELNEAHPMGGERRLVFFRVNRKEPKGWSCPAPLRDKLRAARGRIRMMLATPGIFDRGYLPGWLHDGRPVPGTSVKLRCVAAACDRWQAVSGWSYETGSFGPKAIRRLAPAGSVYFCEVIEGKAEELASAWMRPVSDREQDCRDGYGLALFGVEE